MVRREVCRVPLGSRPGGQEGLWGHGLAAVVCFPQRGIPGVGVRPQGGEALEAQGTVPGLQEAFLGWADPLPDWEGEETRVRAWGQ